MEPLLVNHMSCSGSSGRHRIVHLRLRTERERPTGDIETNKLKAITGTFVPELGRRQLPQSGETPKQKAGFEESTLCFWPVPPPLEIKVVRTVRRSGPELSLPSVELQFDDLSLLPLARQKTSISAPHKPRVPLVCLCFCSQLDRNGLSNSNFNPRMCIYHSSPFTFLGLLSGLATFPEGLLPACRHHFQKLKAPA